MVRGEAFPWSDLDVGVSGLDTWRGLELGAAVAAVLDREAHVVDLDECSDWLRYRVATDGIVLLAATPDTWAMFVARAMLRYWDVEPVIRLCAAGARQLFAAGELHGG